MEVSNLEQKTGRKIEVFSKDGITYTGFYTTETGDLICESSRVIAMYEELISLRKQVDSLSNMLVEKSKRKEVVVNDKDLYGVSAQEVFSRTRLYQKRLLEAQIINESMKGLSIAEIQESLKVIRGEEISHMTVYRALSVKLNEDRNRIISLFSDFSDVFSHFTERDVIIWFSKKRITKLKLVSKDAIVCRYGVIALEDYVKDPYVAGDYYSVRGTNLSSILTMPVEEQTNFEFNYAEV